MPIIEVERLMKTFRTRYRERQAVKPVSLSLEKGEVLTFSEPV